MKCIIKFHAFWQDQIRCEEFILVDEDFDLSQSKILEIIKRDTSFGISHTFRYGTLAKNNFIITKLSNEEWDVLHKVFPFKRFGTGVL